MSAAATSELLDFRRFIDDKLNHGGKHLSPEEVLDEWRETHPESDEFEEEVAAIQEAVDDMQHGDLGRPAHEALADVRARLGL